MLFPRICNQLAPTPIPATSIQDSALVNRCAIPDLTVDSNTANPTAKTAKMSFFRSKKLDLGCFVNIKTIRDHTKRVAFAEAEAER